MHAARYIYSHEQQEFHAYLAYDDTHHQPRPAVLLVHDWGGCGEFVAEKSRLLAQMGYLGFAVDMFGEGRIGTSTEEKSALIAPLVTGDRTMLRERLLAALDAVLAIPEVDKQRIAIIGFCFGGLCALDLARSGADIRAAISFHGLLYKPEHLASKPIKAKILALHGYDDPMVRPEQVNAFCQEMTEAKADWQVHMYGHVQHAFTNPQAHDLNLGTVYHSVAAARSWLAMTHFLQEIFASS